MIDKIVSKIMYYGSALAFSYVCYEWPRMVLIIILLMIIGLLSISEEDVLDALKRLEEKEKEDKS